MARANEQIVRAMAVAPGWFGRLPVSACEVRPVEPFKERDAPPAYYFPPTIDGSRPGIYYVNAYDLPTRLFSKLAATTYHEAVPGHHFQIALEMEHPSLPGLPPPREPDPGVRLCRGLGSLLGATRGRDGTVPG